MSQLVRAEWWRPAPAVHAVVETPASTWRQPVPSPRGTLAFNSLIAFTFILLLAPQAVVPALRPFRIALVAALVGIAARLVDRLHGRPLARASREMTLTAGLVIWSVVTLPLSYWPGGSASFLLDLYFKSVAIFWLLANAVDTLPRLRQVAWALTIMAVPLSLTGIKNFLSGAFIEEGTPNAVRRIVGYEGGLTANPNDLAFMLNLILPLSIGLLLAVRSASARAVLLAIVALQTAGVVVTFSRAGFITLAFTFGVYIWRLARRGRIGWAAAALAIAVATLAVLPADYRARLATITDIDSDPTGSSQARWSDTRAALRFVLEHPVIGAGVGMNTLAMNEVRGPAWKEVHNVFLVYGVELGLPGLVLYLLLFVACLKRVRDVRRRAEGTTSNQLARVAEGIEIALLAFAVAAVFSPVAYHFHFYYLAGLAVAAGAVQERSSTVEEAGARP